MKISSKIARWFVSPASNGVNLTVDGTEYRMSIAEADALSECLDDVALFARNLTHAKSTTAQK